jgi:hypothetical protein
MKNEILVPAIFTFDETECHFEGLHNPQSTWNGWYMPYIKEKSIFNFMDKVNCDELKVTMMDQTLKIVETYEEEVYTSYIAPDEVEGENYYYLGHLGLCFDIVK